MNAIIKSAFKLESLRSKYAAERNYTKLKATYSSKNPAIPNNNIDTHWDGLNEEFGILLSPTANPMAYDRFRIVANNIPQGSVLDVGFGSGSLEKLLERKVVHVRGIDFSAASVKSASQAFSKWHFKTVDINKPWQLDKKSFDYVVCLEVLEHISPSKTFSVLDQIYNYLKNGGKCIISVPLNENLEDMLAKGKNPNAHVRVYTPSLICAELEIAGFTPIKSYQLYAFEKYYRLKTIITNLFFKDRKKPNNIIIIAQKP